MKRFSTLAVVGAATTVGALSFGGGTAGADHVCNYGGQISPLAQLLPGPASAQTSITDPATSNEQHFLLLPPGQFKQPGPFVCGSHEHGDPPN